MRIAARAAWICMALALIGICACAAAGATGYSVRPIPPECQPDQDAWYFDFAVKPGQTELLQVVIMNINETPIEVAVEANAASTNRNGLIEFVQTERRDPSLAVDFGEICVPVEPVVSVPAMGEAVAEFRLSVPDEPFDGVLYGGFLFTMLGQDAQDGQSAMGIANVYRYAVGARLRQGETPVEPEFELLSAELDVGNIPALILRLRNPVAVLARGIELRAGLYPEGGDEPVATFAQSGVEMAPNTQMDYWFELFDRQMPGAGEYRALVELTHDGRTWEFEAPIKLE